MTNGRCSLGAWHALAGQPATIVMTSDPGLGDDLRTRLLEKQRVAERNGTIVLGLLLLVIVWAFSLPVDIRRAVVCSTELELSVHLNGCVSWDELLERVASHYSSCGVDGGPACFRLDLSVDPKSSAAFFGALDALRGS